MFNPGYTVRRELEEQSQGGGTNKRSGVKRCAKGPAETKLSFCLRYLSKKEQKKKYRNKNKIHMIWTDGTIHRLCT